MKYREGDKLLVWDITRWRDAVIKQREVTVLDETAGNSPFCESARGREHYVNFYVGDIGTGDWYTDKGIALSLMKHRAALAYREAKQSADLAHTRLSRILALARQEKDTP